ncbi:CAP domain-containing protein [Paractinoplanes rhizophilus]|uniref:CAP domain-containing protein n=1 Tax=Paractinoplanes rhizophilus TaxID=1416877 RepID=A0ABW2HVF4_9ACTN|nr:CAP domain-containing protein [Actinoplanes sp.]
MRRKRLAVVGVAASALLLTGGIAATSAGAEETPDAPVWPGFTMPDFFAWPGFGASGDDNSRPDDDGSWSDDDGWSDDEDPASGDADDSAGQPAGNNNDNPSRTHEAPAAGVRAAPQQARPKPAAVAQKPAPVRAPAHAEAPHAAGGNLIAAARRGVTAADISNSPHAPVQQQILALINRNRERGGCGGLTLDRRLIDAANEHAADMARRRYFAHESPNGDGAGDRVRESGYRWKRYGENIARGVDSPYEVVDGWMHSPAHRENILDCRLHQMGIGLAIARDDTAYWVQDFATPAT